MKKLLLLPALIFWAFIQFSNAEPVDSIGVATVQGKKFTRHKVDAGDTWYSVARRYGVPYAEVRLANKEFEEPLKVGQIINIPAVAKPTDPSNQKNYTEKANTPTIEKPSVPAKPAATPAAASGDIRHTVAPGETVYRISKMYNVKSEDLCAWNNIQNNSIGPGQVLIIKGASKPDVVVTPAPKEKAEPVAVAPEKKKKEPAPPVAPAVAPVVEKPVPSKPSEPEEKAAPVETSIEKFRKDVQESGEADRVLDEPVNPNKFYALHATAPVGTILMVRNLANDRSVYVKVVGKLEDTDSNRGLVVKLSNSSAEYLKAPKKRFKVELLYGLSLAKGR